MKTSLRSKDGLAIYIDTGYMKTKYTTHTAHACYQRTMQKNMSAIIANISKSYLNS